MTQRRGEGATSLGSSEGDFRREQAVTLSPAGQAVTELHRAELDRGASPTPLSGAARGPCHQQRAGLSLPAGPLVCHVAEEHPVVRRGRLHDRSAFRALRVAV